MDDQTLWAVRQVQRYLREGNPAAVVEIGETLLSHDTDDLDVFMLAGFCLGLAHEQMRHWDRALLWFEQCLTLDPANPLLLAGRGRVWMKMGKAREAAALFRRLAARYPGRPDYHQAAGAALLQTADRPRALEHLRKARELAPANPHVLNDLGEALLLEGDLEAALHAFRQATDHIAPGDVELAAGIRESIEEVRAALQLRERATGRPGSARVAMVGPDDSPPGTLTAEIPAVSDDGAQFYAESNVRAILLEAATEQQCRPRQLLAALHLWSDLLDALAPDERQRTQRRARAWAAGVLYTVGRLDGEPWATQQHIAAALGVSMAALSRRFGHLKQALAIEIGDPRYGTRGSPRRDRLIQHIHEGRGNAEQLLL